MEPEGSLPHSQVPATCLYTQIYIYISTLSLTSALDGGVGSTPSPGRFTPGKTRYPIAEEASWNLGPVWSGAENFVPTGIWSPDRQARSYSLCRLNYSVHIYLCKVIKIKFTCVFQTVWCSKESKALLKWIVRHESSHFQSFYDCITTLKVNFMYTSDYTWPLIRYSNREKLQTHIKYHKIPWYICINLRQMMISFHVYKI
jgi:hypothetical protein